MAPQDPFEKGGMMYGEITKKKVMAILYGTISLVLRSMKTNGLEKTLEDLRQHASWLNGKGLDDKVDHRAYKEMLLGLSAVNDAKTGNDTADAYQDEIERQEEEGE